jgi:hypothetical protein
VIREKNKPVFFKIDRDYIFWFLGISVDSVELSAHSLA